MSVDATPPGAVVVGALTSELLRALCGQCEGSRADLHTAAQLGPRAVFRGVLRRLAALNDALLEAAHAGDGRRGARDEAELARRDLLALVESVRGAMAGEALALSQIPGTTGRADGDRESEVAAARLALRAAVLAPFRAAFARELHERVSSLAWLWGLPARDLDLEPDRELDGGRKGQKKGETEVGSSILSDADAASWRSEWESDCSAQAQHYHALLDRLASMEARGSTTTSASLRTSSPSISKGRAHRSPAVSTVSLLLQQQDESILDTDHRGLLERVRTLLETSPSIRGLASPPEEQERWRRLAVTIDKLSWRSIYAQSEPAALSSSRSKSISSASFSSSTGNGSTSGDSGAATKTPKWLIPTHEVVVVDTLTDESRRSRGVVGRWLDADVLLKPIRLDAGADVLHEGSAALVADIERWRRLSHPNVAKLFGAFVGSEQSFCVCEYEEWGSLDEFAQFADDDEVWQLLYEAALGLQFLHASGIAHGNLRPSSIVVGSDQKAKVDGIGSRSAVVDDAALIDYCFDDDLARWAAPECLRGASGSFESDVYSFGMATLSEFLGRGRLPWGNQEFSVQTAQLVAKKGELPPRPAVLGDDEWALIVRMCAFDPERRPTMSRVLDGISKICQGLDKGVSELEKLKRQTWERVYNAGADLQYRHDVLHTFNGVLASLEAALLVSTSDQSGTDLTAFPTREAALTAGSAGHLSRRWRAPETLNGEPPTAASDVYSLGVRVIEALTRDYAWGGRTPDVVAGDAIIHGRLPRRPAAFSARQWALVARMCALDPNARPTMAAVVAELRKFAYYKKDLAGRDSGRTGSRGTSSNSSSSSSTQEDGASGHGDVESMVLPCLGIPIDQALQETQQLLDRSPELRADANDDVLKRLEDLYESSLRGRAVASVGAKALGTFCDVLERFSQFVRQHTATCSSLSSAGSSLSWHSSSAAASASRSCVRNNFVFHRQLDTVLRHLQAAVGSNRAAGPCDQIHDWRGRWADFRSIQLLRRVETLSGTSTLTNGRVHAAVGDAEEAKAVEEEEATARGDTTSEHDARGSAPPVWFIWPYDVILDELTLLGRGSFGSVHKATWLGATVVVKKILSRCESDAQRAVFDREVSIWYRLHHPHIVKLFGACHVGQPFFVCEFALYGRLDKYLSHCERQRHHDLSFSRVALAWAKIYEACLGLQYLHERGVIHADLKCDNILVAMDGKAKLSDFGLSLVAKRDLAHRQQPRGSDSTLRLGAIRWKAPEVLAGGSPTRASDVYGMAMCLIEAVTGLYPWGNSIPDAAVAVQAKRGGLPMQPCEFSAGEWQLVEAMCRLEPSMRLPIGEVVRVLALRAELAQLEASALG